jgi:hypothetical protein
VVDGEGVLDCTTDELEEKNSAGSDDEEVAEMLLD